MVYKTMFLFNYIGYLFVSYVVFMYCMHDQFLYKLSDTDSDRILGQKYRLPSQKCGRSDHFNQYSRNIKLIQE